MVSYDSAHSGGRGSLFPFLGAVAVPVAELELSQLKLHLGVLEPHPGELPNALELGLVDRVF